MFKFPDMPLKKNYFNSGYFMVNVIDYLEIFYRNYCFENMNIFFI